MFIHWRHCRFQELALLWAFHLPACPVLRWCEKYANLTHFLPVCLATESRSFPKNELEVAKEQGQKHQTRTPGFQAPGLLPAPGLSNPPTPWRSISPVGIVVPARPPHPVGAGIKGDSRSESAFLPSAVVLLSPDPLFTTILALFARQNPG